MRTEQLIQNYLYHSFSAFNILKMQNLEQVFGTVVNKHVVYFTSW